MEEKSVMALKNRIAYLEHYIKKNLEPTIMSLYMDIDRLNKKVKAISNNDSASADPVSNGVQATLGQMPNAGTPAEPKRILSPVENAIQTMEMLKQRNRRLTPGELEHMMQAGRQTNMSNSGKVIDN